MSECLLTNVRQSAVSQLYHDENKLVFNETMIMSALYYANMLSVIFLAHWNNRPWVDISPHSDTLSWFRANQSLLFLLGAACLVEKQQISILKSLVWSDRGSNEQTTSLEVSTITITPPMRSSINIPVLLTRVDYITYIIYYLFSIYLLLGIRKVVDMCIMCHYYLFMVALFF